MTTQPLRKQASKLVLAIALATGTAMIAGHIVPDPAHAQRSKKKKKDKKEKGNAGEYSKEFLATYSELKTQIDANPAGAGALVSQLNALVTSAQSTDERYTAGTLLYNAGIGTKDNALRLQGMEQMISSGKAPPEQLPAYNFTAYQLAEVQEQYPKARGYLQAAIDGGYTNAQNKRSDLLTAMAQNYVRAGEHKQGLTILKQAIAEKKAAGEAIDTKLYQYGFSVAFNNELTTELSEFAQMQVRDYPTQGNWRNAINVVRRYQDLDEGQELDLLRLTRKVGAMTEKAEFMAYVDAARGKLTPYPKEVKEVIEAGYATSNLDRSDPYYTEVYDAVTRRVATDLEELASYTSEARGASAKQSTVLGAANTSLSYEKYTDAIDLYDKALAMAVPDKDEVLVRKGIAQIGSADYAGAQATFAQVGGARQSVAELWSLYASMQSGSNAMAPAAPATMGG